MGFNNTMVFYNIVGLNPHKDRSLEGTSFKGEERQKNFIRRDSDPFYKWRYFCLELSYTFSME